MISLPRLYPILDPSCFSDCQSLFQAALDLASAGCHVLQYRNKSGNARQMLGEARELRERLGTNVKLIMNDRADLCMAAGFDGLHIGQDDLSPEAARRIIGGAGPQRLKPLLYEGLDGTAKDVPFHKPEALHKALPSQVSIGRWLGVSTHNPEQLAQADQTSADYLAIGPVFATSSKANPDPVVGLEGVRRARELTCKPLVAIGGITRANARSVVEAGADSVAVISDLLRSPGKSAEEFFQILR